METQTTNKMPAKTSTHDTLPDDDRLVLAVHTHVRERVVSDRIDMRRQRLLAHRLLSGIQRERNGRRKRQ